jgi:hypothetical protein
MATFGPLNHGRYTLAKGLKFRRFSELVPSAPEYRLNPALAAATLTVSVWRKLMNSLVWQSVMWRPGKGRSSSA